MPLLICSTCPRYDPRSSGEFGQALTAAITQVGEVQIRGVACLGGCPDDGSIAVDGPGKTRIRFNGLTEDDTDAIICAAIAHEASTTGDLDDWQVPPQLKDRISCITQKRTAAVGRAGVGQRPPATSIEEPVM